MSNVSSWSQTAASNNASPPNGFPEGQSPASLNDCARENMAAIAKWYAGLKGGLTSGGSANAYTLTTGSSHASLAAIGLIVFKASFSNTGTCTLNVDSLGAKTIKWNGQALGTGAIVQDMIFAMVYNPTGDNFDLVSAPMNIPALKVNGLTLPTTDGSSGQTITTNGSGVLSFSTISANISYSARTSNTILAAGDKSTLVDVTSGTFSQTLTAAATLGAGWYTYLRNSGTGVVTIDPNGSETINGATTLAIYQGVTALIVCDGSNFFAAVAGDSAGDHKIIVTGVNGFGSTNTAILRFSTTQESNGTAITYADSASNGASFTINRGGIYSIRHVNYSSSGTMVAGISLNSAQLTTAATSITAANLLAVVAGAQGITGNNAACWTGRLDAGDVIRPHGSPGVTYSTSGVTAFEIALIGS